MAGQHEVSLSNPCTTCPEIKMMERDLRDMKNALQSHMDKEEKMYKEVQAEHTGHWTEVRKHLHELRDKLNHIHSEGIVERHQCKEEIEHDVDDKVKRTHQRIDELNNKLDSFITRKDFHLALGAATLAISIMIWLSGTFATKTVDESQAKRLDKIEQILVDVHTGKKP